MIRLFLVPLSLVVALLTPAFAGTPRHNFPYGSNETANSALDKIDQKLKGAVAGDCPIYITTLPFNPTEAGATSDFVNLFDGTASTTEADEDLFRAGITLRATFIRCTVDVAPGAGVDDWKISVRDDGATITPLCSIDEVATECRTSTVSVDIAIGSLLNLIVDSSGAGADPAAAAALECQVCFAQVP